MTHTEVPPMIVGEVVATGTSVNTQLPGLGQLLERAMVDAINRCYAQGITDPASILEAKMEAYGVALREHSPG